MQRVTRASVRVDDEVVGEIGAGLCVLLGVTHGDDAGRGRTMAAKLWQLRVFADEHGVMNHPVSAVGGSVLVVSQFTLYGDTSRGRRPSWAAAAPATVAEPVVTEVVNELGRLGARVATGRFGAMMGVELVNDGPVTLLVEV